MNQNTPDYRPGQQSGQQPGPQTIPQPGPQTVPQPGQIIFCSGGRRSGKSAQALAWAEAALQPGEKALFVATLEVRDTEMRQRVERHRRERGPHWQLLELPLAAAFDLPGQLELACAQSRVLVLDCLGTWVSACLEAAAPELQNDWPGLEKAVLASLEAALDILARPGHSTQPSRPVYPDRPGYPASPGQPGPFSVLVSQETGLGLSPLSPKGRQFVDLLGLVNQRAAARADSAYFMASGLPLRLK